MVTSTDDKSVQLVVISRSSSMYRMSPLAGAGKLENKNPGELVETVDHTAPAIVPVPVV